MAPRGRWAAGLVAALLLPGCDSSHGSPAPYLPAAPHAADDQVVPDSLVVRSAPRANEPVRISRRIAAVAAAEGLFSVRGGWLLRDGRLAVLDAGNFRIRIFDGNARPVLDFGGFGSGPGEYRDLRAGSLSHDRVWTFDAATRSLAEWDLSGELRGTVSLTELPAPPGHLPLLWRGTFDDGSFLFQAVPVAPPMGRSRPTAIYYAGRPSALVQVGSSPADEMYTFLSQRGGYFVMRPLFPRSTHVAVHGSSFYLFDTARPEFRIYDRHGSLRCAVRFPDRRPQLTEADRLRAIAARLDERDARHGAMFRKRYDEMPVPALPPVATAAPGLSPLVVDREGSVWLPDFASPGQSQWRWLRFDPEGAAFVSFEFPLEVAVLDATDAVVLALWRDDLGAERVGTFALPSETERRDGAGPPGTGAARCRGL